MVIATKHLKHTNKRDEQLCMFMQAAIEQNMGDLKYRPTTTFRSCRQRSAKKGWKWGFQEMSELWYISAGNNNILGSHSGVSVRRASGQDSCSEEPGRLAAPQLRKWRAYHLFIDEIVEN